MTINLKNIDKSDIFEDTMLFREKSEFGYLIFRLGFIEIMEIDVISFPAFNLN